MSTSHSFDSLAGVQPGVTTVSEVTSRFGPPVVSEASEGGLFLNFPAHGIAVIVNSIQCGNADPVIDEVRLTSPDAGELPCGIRVGQPQSAALETVRRFYPITDEYEDAVYFRPSLRDDLLASVEFLDAGAVVCLELMRKQQDS
jgi:hypothetical protein